MAAPLHLQVLLRNRCWILPIRCPNMFPQNGLLDLFRFSGQTYGTPEIFFRPLNLGYLGFWTHFPQTVCPCRFIFAVCLALFDSTILLYEYQSHQVELFLCDYSESRVRNRHSLELVSKGVWISWSKKNCYYFSKRKWKYFYTFNHFYNEKSSKRAK